MKRVIIGCMVLLTGAALIIDAAAGAGRQFGRVAADRLVIKAVDTGAEIYNKSGFDPFAARMPGSKNQRSQREFGELQEGVPHRKHPLFGDVGEMSRARKEAMIEDRQRKLELEMGLNKMATAAERAEAKRQAKKDAEEFVQLQIELEQTKLQVSFIRAQQAQEEVRKFKKSLSREL